MFLETSYFDRINDVDINNLAGYEERTRVLYMIHPWKGNPLDAKVPYGQNFAIQTWLLIQNQPSLARLA